MICVFIFMGAKTFKSYNALSNKYIDTSKQKNRAANCIFNLRVIGSASLRLALITVI